MSDADETLVEAPADVAAGEDAATDDLASRVEDPSEAVAEAPAATVPDEPVDGEPDRLPNPDAHLAKVVEALLFLAPEPVPLEALAEATETTVEDVDWALGEIRDAYADRGIGLREVAGGWTLASDPIAEPAARRLLAKPRTPPLSPAQAETLSIVAYLQPVSRPEVARIRGVSSDHAAATLLERGLIEEQGRSQFGAVLYRTTPLFLKLFGLNGLDDLPDPTQWDPTPEEQGELRDRLLRAGEARAGVAAVTTEPADDDEG